MPRLAVLQRRRQGVRIHRPKLDVAVLSHRAIQQRYIQACDWIATNLHEVHGIPLEPYGRPIVMLQITLEVRTSPAGRPCPKVQTTKLSVIDEVTLDADHLFNWEVTH